METPRVDLMATTTPGRIRAELARVESPLLPFAGLIYRLGLQYRVDPALFLAVSWIDNQYGMLQRLTGMPTDTWDPATRSGTFNWGRLDGGDWGGQALALGTGGQYPNIESGIEAFFRWIAAEFYPRGQRTVDQIWWGVGGTAGQDGEHAYAPPSQNAPFTLQLVLDVMGRVAGPPTAFAATGTARRRV